MRIQTMNKNIYLTSLLILSMGLSLMGTPLPIYAASCTAPSDGESNTISTSCTMPEDSIDGVDNGDLTIATSTTLTINANQVLVFNPGKNLNVNGSIAISNTGAKIRKGYIWITDADADGYAASAYSVVFHDSAASPPGGDSTLRLRRNVVHPKVNVDCDDSNPAVQTASTTPVNGGWSAWSAWSSCSGESGACEGTQSRTRTCTNPAPSCGGADCSGSSTDTQACSITSRVAGAWCGSSTSVHGSYTCGATYNSACTLTGSGTSPPGRKCTHTHNYGWNSTCTSCDDFLYYSNQSNTPTSQNCFL